MCKRLTWFVLGMLLSPAVLAQYAGFKPVGNMEAFRTRFAAESGKIQTIESDFVQEKKLEVLEEKITSTGTFRFKRSDRVRIDYLEPFKYMMVMNNGELLVRDDQKENKVNVRSNKLFQQVNEIMVDAVQGTILNNKNFTTKVFESEGRYLLEMTPVDKALKNFFSTVLVYVDRHDYSVAGIEMRESSGDSTNIQFTQKQLNVPIADNVFAIR